MSTAKQIALQSLHILLTGHCISEFERKKALEIVENISNTPADKFQSFKPYFSLKGGFDMTISLAPDHSVTTTKSDGSQWCGSQFEVSLSQGRKSLPLDEIDLMLDALTQARLLMAAFQALKHSLSARDAEFCTKTAEQAAAERKREDLAAQRSGLVDFFTRTHSLWMFVGSERIARYSFEAIKGQLGNPESLTDGDEWTHTIGDSDFQFCVNTCGDNVFIMCKRTS